MKNLTNRQKQAINTKLKITRVAIELYKEKGASQVTVQDICGASDISVGAFYHHFNSKNDILSTSYEQVDRLIKERIGHQVYDNFIHRLVVLFTESATLTDELGWTFLSGVYKNLLAKTPDYVLANERYINQVVSECLVQGVEAGDLNPQTDIDTLRNTIVRIARGAIFDWCLHEGTTDLTKTMLSDVQLALNYATSTQPQKEL